jgi:redox-sensitive bicupin YhaK (pirin superfamily)
MSATEHIAPRSHDLGGGIVHSERTPPDLRTVSHRTHGLQLWTAAPADNEEDAPRFDHFPARAILSVSFAGARVRAAPRRSRRRSPWQSFPIQV